MSNLLTKQATKKDILIIFISIMCVFLFGYEMGQIISTSRLLTLTSSSADNIKNIELIRQHLMILLGIIWFMTGAAFVVFYKHRRKNSGNSVPTIFLLQKVFYIFHY
ncbi:MAG: hypothetical protein N4A40_08820 [Tissierellales bacterium]|nr:hypothetical protein [Tissierellales bacterium]